MIKQKYKELKSKILVKFWGDLDDEFKEKVILFLENVTNYLFNSLLISIPIYIISLKYSEPSLSRWILIVLALFPTLIYIEHYYVWFRSEWRKKIKY